MTKKQKQKSGKIQWHPGLYAGFELEFKKYDVEIVREHKLTRAPLSIDLLIIHKTSDEIIDNGIGNIFRRYNIVELKSPDDVLSIDVYYKIQAYASLYKTQGEKTNAIPAEDITITLFRDRYPRKLISLLETAGSKIVRTFPGIYEVKGNCLFPTQIVVSSELEAERHSVLRIISRQANKEDVLDFARKAGAFTDQADKDRVDSVLLVSSFANRKLYSSIIEEDEAMNNVLMELMKDKIDEKVSQGRKEGRREGKINALKDLVTDGILSLSDAAKRAGLSVTDFKTQAGLK